jgi:hypothetical protein
MHFMCQECYTDRWPKKPLRNSRCDEDLMKAKVVRPGIFVRELTVAAGEMPGRPAASLLRN